MSKTLNQQAVTQFESQLKHSFQMGLDEGFPDPRTFCRVKDAKGAATVKFPLLGKGKMQKRDNIFVPHPMANLSHSSATATISRYSIKEMTDIFDQSETNVEERQELVKSMTAMGKRQMLQVVIDALGVPTYTNTMADTDQDPAKATADDWTFEGLRTLTKIQDGIGIPGQDRHILMSHVGLHHLSNDEKIASADYNTSRILQKAGADEFYGQMFHKVGNMDEGGMPVPSSNHRTSWGFHRSAVGLAINIEPKLEISYNYDYSAWQVVLLMSLGAVVIDEEGVVEVTTDETNS